MGFRVEARVRELPEGLIFGRCSAELPGTTDNGFAATNGVERIFNQPRRPLARSFRGHVLVLPDDSMLKSGKCCPAATLFKCRVFPFYPRPICALVLVPGAPAQDPKKPFTRILG